MLKNDLIRKNNTIYRILEIDGCKLLTIDCCKRTMPQWCDISAFEEFVPCTEQELAEETSIKIVDIDLLEPATSIL